MSDVGSQLAYRDDSLESKERKKSYSYDERFRNSQEYVYWFLFRTILTFERCTLILSGLSKLRDQRDQTYMDLEFLKIEKEKAQRDPQSYFLSLETRKDFAPKRQKVVEVPEVDILKFEKLKDKKYVCF